MGFVLLFTLGIAMGWLASLVTLRDRWSAVALYACAGVAGALLTGEIASQHNLLLGVSGVTVLAGAIGATIAILVAHVVAEKLDG